VFSAHGSYMSPQAFTSGLTAALPIGAAVLAAGTVIALLVPGAKRRTTPADAQRGTRPTGATSPAAW
jgi:hypothetical protein